MPSDTNGAARPKDTASPPPAISPLREGTVRLSLVVPVYNEESTVESFLAQVAQALSGCPDIVPEFIFVNDGSTDATLPRLMEQQQQDSRIVVLDLSRNFGKEAALSAGLEHADGDVVIPMDVDLQDPPELIPRMLKLWREGYDVVLGHRTRRSTDSWMKRHSAGWFYKIYNLLTPGALPENVGDFRLMDRCVVEAIKSLPETQRFMKGILAWVGFPTASIPYTRPRRTDGKSKFNGWRLWNLALQGITSFSTAPLRVWTYLGLGIAFISFALGLFILTKVLLFGVDVPGYASLMVMITFLGGLQLIGIGVLGEYLGRTYMESKRRPLYLVRNIYKNQQAE